MSQEPRDMLNDAVVQSVLHTNSLSRTEGEGGFYQEGDQINIVALIAEKNQFRFDIEVQHQQSIKLEIAVKNLETEVGDLKAENGSLKTEVGDLKAEFGELKAGNGSLKAELELEHQKRKDLELRVDRMETEIEWLRGMLDVLINK
jgi:predicted RNase H-like nuclease (RuvC/YqgF family)